jgi:uncharacterized membrane protein YdjX (TVP38/TMEM64 family)
MSLPVEHKVAPAQACREASGWRRFLPLALVLTAMVVVFAAGWHRHLSLETLVRHRMAIDAFIDAHEVGALLTFVAIYIVVVALSLPGALILTISGGILFGTFAGGGAAVIAATIGAVIIFLIARSACGEGLVRRAGPLAAKIAEGFRADAFSYLLFLRLVPAFPFFLVNLAPALCGVRLATFAAATAVGIIPPTFAFAFLGSGLDSVLARQAAPYIACVNGGRTDCRVDFDWSTVVTPQLVAAFALLGVLALIPVVVKRLRARAAQPDATA